MCNAGSGSRSCKTRTNKVELGELGGESVQERVAMSGQASSHSDRATTCTPPPTQESNEMEVSEAEDYEQMALAKVAMLGGKRPMSPPTPAASPAPFSNQSLSQPKKHWRDSEPSNAVIQHKFRSQFRELSRQEQLRVLMDTLDECNTEQISFISSYIAPKLKRDFLKLLPVELGLRIISHIDDPKTLARASQVSKHWYDILNDDLTWKRLCAKHRYRRLSSMTCIKENTMGQSSYFTPGVGDKSTGQMAPQVSYKSHFRKRYQVETAWKNGGYHIAKHIASESMTVVTSLHLTHEFIIIGLDNSKIHLFKSNGKFLRSLVGHESGVWALCPWGNTLVSGGCDRDIRVWDMTTGACKFVLSGHTSTVRCLRMVNATTAISGARDATLRVWDIQRGKCLKVLVGHSFSVRCLDAHGDICVSGSYDTTAKIWSISRGVCLKTLEGHYGQIYDVAFDGRYICTGSLDTNIRVWDVYGNFLAVLQVSGGSDGWVRVWNLERFECVHRLAAHDNSVTSLQFDDDHIVSGGRDGRVTLWDTNTGALIRELVAPADEVWRVAFHEEKAVISASRGGKICMEVISFAPAEDEPSPT